MLHFICEHRFIADLARIEQCAIKADEIVQRVEFECAAAVAPGSAGYRFLCLDFKPAVRLWIWYLVIGSDVTLLTMERASLSA
jgi:hypothetical protein